MSKDIHDGHKALIFQGLEIKKTIEEESISKKIIAHAKNHTKDAIKDYHGIKHQLKIMKDVASLFNVND